MCIIDRAPALQTAGTAVAAWRTRGVATGGRYHRAYYAYSTCLSFALLGWCMHRKLYWSVIACRVPAESTPVAATHSRYSQNHSPGHPCCGLFFRRLRKGRGGSFIFLCGEARCRGGGGGGENPSSGHSSVIRAWILVRWCMACIVAPLFWYPLGQGILGVSNMRQHGPHQTFKLRAESMVWVQFSRPKWTCGRVVADLVESG